MCIFFLAGGVAASVTVKKHSTSEKTPPVPYNLEDVQKVCMKITLLIVALVYIFLRHPAIQSMPFSTLPPPSPEKQYFCIEGVLGDDHGAWGLAHPIAGLLVFNEAKRMASSQEQVLVVCFTDPAFEPRRAPLLMHYF
jgi:hypothetical protein